MFDYQWSPSPGKCHRDFENHKTAKKIYVINVTGLCQRVIKGTKVIAVIKRMRSRDKDQTWKTEVHNKEHRVTTK